MSKGNQIISQEPNSLSNDSKSQFLLDEFTRISLRRSKVLRETKYLLQTKCMQTWNG